MAAYVGPARPIATLFTGFPHGLEQQSYAPASMLSGHVNVDGTGVAWWPHLGSGEPLRYASPGPPWSDANLASLGPRIDAEVQLALVRSATPGMPHSVDAVAPFVRRGLAFAHNGFIADFHGTAFDPLLLALDPLERRELNSVSDSQLMFMHLLQRRREHPGETLSDQVRATLDRLLDIIRRADTRARLDLLVSDGSQLVAVRAATGFESNQLYTAQHANGACLIASEPLDTCNDWTALPAQSLIELHATRSAEPILGAPQPIEV